MRMVPSTVMLSAAKHLAADRDRRFAEFILSEANVLRVTAERSISSSVLFFETALSALFRSIVSYFQGNEKLYVIIASNAAGFTTSYSLPSCCTTCLRSEGVIVQTMT
jgi:hypothetical protein